MNSGVFAEPKFANAKPFSAGARPDAASTRAESPDEVAPPEQLDNRTATITTKARDLFNIGSTVTDPPMVVRAGDLSGFECLDPETEEFDQVVEPFVQCVGLGVPIVFFEHTESVKSTAQRPRTLRSLGH